VEALGAVARRTLPKNLIRLLPVQDRKDESFRDLLTRSPVHASDRIGVATEAKTLAQLDTFWHGRPVAYIVLSNQSCVTIMI
jgi:predicted ABC-type exoprotein transport system permease subunit